MVALFISAFGITGTATSLGAATPPTPTQAASLPAGGMWMLAANGRVTAISGARSYGDLVGKSLNAPARVLVATPTGHGYWIAATDGGIFGFGDAKFYGSMGAHHLNQPIVGMARTPSGKGYWMVASDGGIFGFGDAKFYGSTGAMHLNQPIVGMTPTPTGHGYWLVATDGGIFGFGDAHFHGSLGAQSLSAPVVGMIRTPSGQGYWMFGQNGVVYRFGDARYFGNGPTSSPAASLLPTATGDGYWMISATNSVTSLGAATPVSAPASSSPIIAASTRYAASGSGAVTSSGPPIFWPGDHEVALTFDDGPNAPYTQEMVATLAAYGVPATFFTVGYEAAARPDLLQLEARNGNSVEDHSWDHPDLTRLSPAAIASQLSSDADAVQRAIGVRPICFRPPYGSTNSTVRSVGASLGLTQILWNVDPSDYTRPGVGYIVNNILGAADGKGLLIGMHDGGGPRDQTIAALPTIITSLRARGYHFVRLCA